MRVNTEHKENPKTVLVTECHTQTYGIPKNTVSELGYPTETKFFLMAETFPKLRT
jgi:hypothetical protein